MVRRHPFAVLSVAAAALGAGIVWLADLPDLGRWLQIHLGIVDEAGPYYGFWSGFGSDIAELSILGAAGTAVWQLGRKFNCHEPGCWRIGNHPAADGQFMLCYRHHPEYGGTRPTRELIKRLHREHLERRAVLHSALQSLHHSAAPSTPGRDHPAPADGSATLRPNRASASAAG